MSPVRAPRMVSSSTAITLRPAMAPVRVKNQEAGAGVEARGVQVLQNPADGRLRRQGPPRLQAQGPQVGRFQVGGVLAHRRLGPRRSGGSGHGVPRCTAFVTEPVRDGRIVSRGHQHAHGAPTTRPAPWNRRPGARKHRDGGDPRRPGPPATTDPSHLPIACTGRLVDEGIEASAGAVGSSLRRRRRPGPGQAPCKRGARSGATARDRVTI